MTSPSNDDSPAGSEASEHRIVGARLREAREVIGLTQGDVAGALGIPRTSVIAMESGRRKVTGLELRRLARLYRRDVAWLLGDDPKPVAADAALFRATEALAPEDREQVLRFAQFLAAGGAARHRGSAPPSTDRGGT